MKDNGDTYIIACSVLLDVFCVLLGAGIAFCYDFSLLTGIAICIGISLVMVIPCIEFVCWFEEHNRKQK